MTRLRSPSYPDITLQQATDAVGKIYAANRTYPMDREVAATEMGYTGLTGPSAKRLASLIQFGLLERHAKNEVRVSDVAEAILHPDDPAQRLEGLRTAAYNPPLFRDLQEKFPHGAPSESNLVSYLLKNGFSDRGVRRATKAYLGTYEYIEQVSAYESHGTDRPDHAHSSLDQRDRGDRDMDIATHDSSVLPAGAHQKYKEPDRNAINVSISGGLVRTHEMILDADGLAKLKRKIDALHTLVADEIVDAEADEDHENGGGEDEAPGLTENNT